MATINKMPSYEDMIAQAEAAVAALRETYREQLLGDVEELYALWARLEAGEPVAPLMNEIFGIAHNVKGQGGSFGYDLVTSIGASLCEYIREAERHTADELNIVHAHMKILKVVGENDITGAGGDTGQRIIAKLHALTHRQPCGTP